MSPEGEKLRKHLDPIAIRVLRKRLISGEITPQVFKDILKRQMVKYFFRNYENPMATTWSGWKRAFKQRIGVNGFFSHDAGDRLTRHKRF